MTELDIKSRIVEINGRFAYLDKANLTSDVTFSTYADAAAALTVYWWYVAEALGTRLKQENMLVTFTKADGTQRTMLCTAQSSAFPVREAVESTTKRAPNPEVQVVMDLEKNVIRSFRKDSITSVQVA